MRHEDQVTVAEFERRVAELPEVVAAHRLFGEPDYLLRIAVADLAAHEPSSPTCSPACRASRRSTRT